MHDWSYIHVVGAIYIQYINALSCKETYISLLGVYVLLTSPEHKLKRENAVIKTC